MQRLHSGLHIVCMLCPLVRLDRRAACVCSHKEVNDERSLDKSIGG
jgi:hypothetical protein